LLDDVIRTVVEAAHENGGVRVVRVTLRVGGRSDFTTEQFAAAARGTLAEGAEVEVVPDDDPQADAVVVESVVVEPFEPLDVW
jgi:Zn finger protein HypA/HybF involved in hydrogenase expression